MKKIIGVLLFLGAIALGVLAGMAITAAITGGLAASFLSTSFWTAWHAAWAKWTLLWVWSVVLVLLVGIFTSRK